MKFIAFRDLPIPNKRTAFENKKQRVNYTKYLYRKIEQICKDYNIPIIYEFDVYNNPYRNIPNKKEYVEIIINKLNKPIKARESKEHSLSAEDIQIILNKKRRPFINKTYEYYSKLFFNGKSTEEIAIELGFSQRTPMTVRVSRLGWNPLDAFSIPKGEAKSRFHAVRESANAIRKNKRVKRIQKYTN